MQVVFHKVEPGSIFIGDELASPHHVWVRADIRSGRSKEQKARMLQRVMRETDEILGISDQAVWVYISDIPAQGVLEFGNVLPDPGGEEQWLPRYPARCARSFRKQPDEMEKAPLERGARSLTPVRAQ